MEDLAAEILTSLEYRELRLLTWGYVDGGFAREEVLELLDEELVRREDFETEPETLLDEMLRRRLVVEIQSSRGELFRSRMGETVRLLARLRQLFPKHAGENWTAASALVADFRILARPREFPRRTIEPENALEELAAAGSLAPSSKEVASVLLGARGTKFALSRFQVDATRSILDGIASHREGGTIVSAGTGSGKTLAFYLPALSATVPKMDESHETRILALYPRTELLRDQLRQALGEATALRDLPGTPRPLRIGALYGKTPWTAAGVNSRFTKWEQTGGGHACPFTTCPACEDAGDLVWRNEDRESGNERLVCATCNAAVESLVLTRESLRARPPDALFTTTEMLNRSMSDPRARSMIGLGSGGGIDLVLLDEVHTYGGTHGAHVAALMKRWRAAHGRSAHFVGLSATLAEATQFFADITGLPPYTIQAIEPRPEDLEVAGQEYLLVLRSDPLSGAGVLSTSIQTAMLLERSLDRQTHPTSDGSYGQRLFTFTDDLDVTNRLYFDLLDAEGRGARNFSLKEKVPLASLRAPSGSDLSGRRDAGQIWDLPQAIGWPLTPEEGGRLRIGRTSSQDAGVDRDSDVIVATASLEVGFDDDRVGGVLQHKTPHDDAAFLQRRGRAGRTRQMRPWTAVVLSDFGRDRLTYQSYEKLFSPYLAPRALPVANPVVLRMQAVFALMEWLAGRQKVSVWPLLSGPAKDDDTAELQLRAKAAKTLGAVITEPPVRNALVRHLERSLNLDTAAVEDLLWEPPRPLLTTVIPTAIRRLETNWRTASGGDRSDRIGDGPLPEFVVSRLFADLELPEIIAQADEDQHAMGAVQALQTYVPGRVSHRLTIRRRRDRSWIEPPPLEDGELASFEISKGYMDLEELGDFQSASRGPAIRCVRPSRLSLTEPPKEVRSSSNARLEWESELVPTPGQVHAIEIEEHLPASDLVSELLVFTHGRRAPVEVRRWSRTASLELNIDGHERRGRISFVDQDEAVGIGVVIDVDGLGIRLAPAMTSSLTKVDPAHERGLRRQRFHEDVVEAPELRERVSVFAAQAIAEAYLAALADVAGNEGDARDAHSRLLDSGLSHAIETARAALPHDAGAQKRDGARSDETDVIVEVVSRAAPLLWEDIDEAWRGWVAERTRATVGAAVHRALQMMCPEFDFDEVSLDLRLRSADSQSDDEDFIWLTESTPGGAGALQEAARRVAARPWVFSDLVLDALQPRDAELVDRELRNVARLSIDDADLAECLESVRGAERHEDRVQAFDRLREALMKDGVLVAHVVMSAVSSRLLRPGSTRRTDSHVAALLERWDLLENRLGCEISLATFAWVAADDDEYDRATGINAPSGSSARRWRAGQIMGLLWPRGSDTRSAGLRPINRFHELPLTDRLLATRLIKKQAESVHWTKYGEVTGPDGPLSKQGVLDMAAAPGELQELRATLLQAAVGAVESGALLLSPSLVAVRRDSAGLVGRLTIDELI